MTVSRRPFLAAIVLATFLAGCDDDPTRGKPDTTPPEIAAVTPVDIYHVDVTFTEEVTRDSAEDEDNYLLAVSTPASRVGVPGDTLIFSAAALREDRRTVSITSFDTMSGLSMELLVEGVSDPSGNRIESVITNFIGSSLLDETPPEIVFRSPGPGSTDASVGAPVVIQFSEPVVFYLMEMSWTSASGPVSFMFDWEAATLTVWPRETLTYNELQTISLSNVEDMSGNLMLDTQWQFTTTRLVDDIQPRLVSSSPANLATRVDIDTDISLTFSERVRPDGRFFDIIPWEAGFGNTEWSDDGRTATFDPVRSLLADQQYKVILFPGGVTDLAGNAMVEMKTVVFTTGTVLQSGSVAGTILGDPGSAAADPTGALVIAESYDITDYVLVEGNNRYKIPYLLDGTYYLTVYMDTDHDGDFDPWYGDAIGAYGVNLAAGDLEPDSVVIARNQRTGLDFPIYDPSAIAGTIAYDGAYADGEWSFYVGLFRTTGFDPDNPGYPVASTGGWWYGYGDWFMNSIPDQIPDGDYYLFAYMNVNEFNSYEPGVDPAGMYGGLESPDVLHVENGADFRHIVIPLVDPVSANSTARVVWPVRERNPAFERLVRSVQQVQSRMNK